MIDDAALHTLEDRRLFRVQDPERSTKYLLLDGEPDDGYNLDGVNLLDEATSMHYYIEYIAYLAADGAESVEERYLQLRSAIDGITTADEYPSELIVPKSGLVSLMSKTRKVARFNFRPRTRKSSNE